MTEPQVYLRDREVVNLLLELWTVVIQVVDFHGPSVVDLEGKNLGLVLEHQ